MLIDNSKESAVGGAWQNPGAALYDKILESDNYKSVLKEAYLIAPVNNINNAEEDRTSFSASGVGYPHHVIRNGKLVLHKTGLRAAFSRGRQQGIVKGEVEAHLVRHYREMGWYEESTISGEAEHSGFSHAEKTDDRERKDNEWVQNELRDRFVRTHNAIVDSMNRSLVGLNSRQKGRNIRLEFRDNSVSVGNSISRTYLEEFNKMYTNTLNNFAASRDWDKSPSGNYRVVYTLVIRNNRPTVNWRIAPTTRTGYSTADLVNTSGQLDQINQRDLFDIADGMIRDINPISRSLAHYGVLGMKWGRRRSQSSEEYQRARALRAKGVRNLSTAELKELTQRMQFERQFKDLTKTEISSGRKFATDLLKDIGRELAKEAIKGAVKSRFKK